MGCGASAWPRHNQVSNGPWLLCAGGASSHLHPAADRLLALILSESVTPCCFGDVCSRQKLTHPGHVLRQQTNTVARQLHI